MSGITSGIVKIAVIFIALGIGNIIYSRLKVEPIKPPAETWWGPGKASEDDKSIVQFKINIDDKVIEDLNSRLKSARSLIPPLENTQQQYGFNTILLKKISEFWLTKYNWREREKFLNQLPQFKTQIQGLQIHFIHAKPKSVPQGVKIVPLLLIHGWPGSIREFYEFIPLLTSVQKDRRFVFEVIAPSLPGYGFSEATSKPGMGAQQVAVIFKNLMRRLGHDRFYVQGGDWGAVIGSAMAIFYPEHVKGLHLNGCTSSSGLAMTKVFLGSFWPSLVVEEKYQKKLYPLSEYFSNFMLEFGYAHLQATKPDTVGVALNDSPIGLAAYILEKFITWTNADWKNLEDGGLTQKFTYTNLLDNVMIYWVTNSITTSMRLYAETMNRQQPLITGPVNVPTACGVFERDFFFMPPDIFKDNYNQLVQINSYEAGHFPAFEAPQLLAKDVWMAAEKFENITSKDIKP